LRISDCAGDSVSPNPGGLRIENGASQSAIRNPKSAIDNVPLAGLRLETEVIVYLNKLGLHRIGELLDQPRETLPSRFGSKLIERIDQLLGDAAEMVPLLRPPPEIRIARAFEYPVKNCELLMNIVAQLTGNLARELRAQNKGARQIECWLYREADDPLCMDVALFKAAADKKHLVQLLRTRMETLPRLLARHTREIRGRDSHVEAEEGICAVALHVVSSEKLDAGQLDLFEKESEDSGPSTGICVVVDRIVSRLGFEAALRAVAVEDAQPECAVRVAPFNEVSVQSKIQNPKSKIDAQSKIARPLRLLSEPVALLPNELRSDGFPALFESRGRSIAVADARGPERIESGWWRSSYVRRDYYIVDSQQGSRYWIFRRLDDGRWFLHGIFE
jgi:protein ImuB